MSDDPPISLSLKDAHRAAINDVNRWRGHCTELFSRIDAAVAATLEAMAEAGVAVKTPHLFGQRVAALRPALAATTIKSAPILKTFDKLEPYLARRNILIHGTGSVWINLGGSWLWSYCMTPSGKSRSKETGSIERGEAHAMETDLAPLCRSFCAQLANLRAGLVPNRRAA